MGITAKELAARLNLSATAVSMALNGKPGVSTETRALVIREAEKAGYDFSRLSMKKNVTGDIYCIICRAHNAILNYTPIFSELTEGIEQECRKNGYHLKTFQLYEKADDLQKYIEELRISQCAGVILLGTEVSASVCHEFLQLSVPVILLDSYFDSADCSCVLINNAQGAYLATSYLIDRCGRSRDTSALPTKSQTSGNVRTVSTELSGNMECPPQNPLSTNFPLPSKVHSPTCWKS